MPGEENAGGQVGEILLQSEVLRSIQVVNGLEDGALTRALAVEHVGTVIHRS